MKKEKNRMKITLLLIGLFAISHATFGQDTIRLKTMPRVIIKSWYPEFKEFPTLRIGESKILVTLIPDFEKTPLRNNDINLITSNSQVKIEENEKPNQYSVLVNSTEATYVELEVWFEMKNTIILLNQNAEWVNIKDAYPIKDNRVFIDTVKLKIVK